MTINYLNLIQPKEVEIDGKLFIISKLPAIAGREIFSEYLIPLVAIVSSAFNGKSDLKLSQEHVLKLMNYVAVKLDNGTILRLSTRGLVDNHVTSDFSTETLFKLEDHMIGYNCSFLTGGLVSNSLIDIAQKLPTLISQILMGLSEQSLSQEKQH